MSRIPTTLAELVRRPFNYLHLAWGILILLGCVALVAMGGGHPPPMVFVPVLLVAGLAGNLLLLLVAWLLRLGRSRFAAAHADLPRWPPELILIALALGLLAIAAIAVTVGELARLRTRPLEWMLFAAVATVHAAAFTLLLLRIGAARYLIAAVCLGWGLALVLQLGEARPGELPIAVAIVGGLIAIAAYVLLAGRIRSVFM
jgi:hypothetical protein